MGAYLHAVGNASIRNSHTDLRCASGDNRKSGLCHGVWHWLGGAFMDSLKGREGKGEGKEAEAEKKKGWSWDSHDGESLCEKTALTRPGSEKTVGAYKAS